MKNLFVKIKQWIREPYKSAIEQADFEMECIGGWIKSGAIGKPW